MAHILAESSNACPFPTIDLFDWNISSLVLCDIFAKHICQNINLLFLKNFKIKITQTIIYQIFH